MRNVTITLDEETARRARIRAAELDLSLSKFVVQAVREKLASSARTSDPEYQGAMKRFLSGKPVPLREPGEKLPTRDEIYAARLRRY